MDVASWYINVTASGIHEIFSHLCEFGSINTREGNIPSWVPDWSTRRQQFLPDRAVKTRWDLRCSDGYHQMHIHWGRESRERAWRFFDSLLPASIPKFQREVHEWLQSRNFFSVRLGALGQKLRVDCHFLAFFVHGGITDQVLCPSTAPNFWKEVIAALELRNIDPYSETYLFEEQSLLTLLAKINGDEDDDAHEPQFGADRSIEDLRDGLHALRDRPDALSDDLKAMLNRISSSLRHLAIVRIEALGGSYWAIGPPNSLVGDWVVPLMLPELDRYVPMMCLRPISPTETDRLLHRPSGARMQDRFLRFFPRESAAQVGCLHVAAKFVGRASHCDGRRHLHLSQGYLPPSQENRVLRIIRSAFATATAKGLPGPIVFDIV